MKPKFREGLDARKKFEETMQKLFRAPKAPKQEKPPKKAALRENEK